MQFQAHIYVCNKRSYLALCHWVEGKWAWSTALLLLPDSWATPDNSLKQQDWVITTSSISSNNLVAFLLLITHLAGFARMLSSVSGSSKVASHSLWVSGVAGVNHGSIKHILHWTPLFIYMLPDAVGKSLEMCSFILSVRRGLFITAFKRNKNNYSHKRLKNMTHLALWHWVEEKGAFLIAFSLPPYSKMSEAISLKSDTITSKCTNETP